MSPPAGPLAESIALYLAHKRSLGKGLAKVGPVLHLLDNYLRAQGIAELPEITPSHFTLAHHGVTAGPTASISIADTAREVRRTG